MRLIPRYRFHDGELCPHGDPDCLCDVHIGEPAPILTGAPHLFHQLALDEMDDWHLTADNFYEFATIVLGAFEAVNRLEDVTRTSYKTNGPDVWQRLPEDLRSRLYEHYVIGTPWELAILELEDEQLNDAEMKKLRTFYKQRLWNNGAMQRRAAQKQNRTAVCGNCGAFIGNLRSSKTIWCSTNCRVAGNRKLRKAKQADAN